MEKVLNLLPKEAAERLRTTVGTLAVWRVKGQGPRYIKMGRKVLYPLPEIEAFEREHLRSNTTGVRDNCR
ncbi:DNA-binding protein [Burkholderia sp. AU31624]|uniref:helix-turn-helix transcriptional regulator n=1 Tax=Burkholderia sp. AU31624 TaxID=2879629 RepID=UPI001CF483D1|nr:DNA-binding protein [Burkholderia sp. AU31624]MCA8254809.1 DNA-binding protein [Burkholderia sp. AU31624]